MVESGKSKDADRDSGWIVDVSRGWAVSLTDFVSSDISNDSQHSGRHPNLHVRHGTIEASNEETSWFMRQFLTRLLREI